MALKAWGVYHQGMKRIRSYHGAGILFWTRDDDGAPTILLGKRSMKPQNHHWAFPGGGWEGEDGFDSDGNIAYRTTAIRESTEEMGIVVPDPDGLKLVWSLALPFFHYKVFSYELDHRVTPPVLSEFSEYRWCTLESLPKPMVLFVHSQIRSWKLRS